MKKFLILLAVMSSPVFATPVNINSADAQTIADSLDGIGLKKAEAIIEYRTKNGAFKSAEDLVKVVGIGEKTLEKIKADVLLSDVPGTAAPTAADKKKI